MSKQYFTEQQPTEGDCVLHCEHVKEVAGLAAHFFSLGAGQPFMRPDGSKGSAQWIVICDHCYVLFPKSPMDAVSGDSLWVGNDPVIKKDVQ